MAKKYYVIPALFILLAVIIGLQHVLTNFWRSVENLTILPADDSTNVWGVSQASPMRRVHVRGNLQLHACGYASGGFLADTRIDGVVLAGGQQQWFSRNSEWLAWGKGSWNIFSMGVPDAPATKWPEGQRQLLPEAGKPEVRTFYEGSKCI